MVCSVCTFSPLAAQQVEEARPVVSPGLAAALGEFRAQTGRLTGPAAGVAKAAARPAQKTVWHGRLYENLRNNAFDAIPHQIVQRNGQQRKLRRNQYGFSVTGPVVAPKVYNGAGKTFFTLTYEGMRESIGQFNLNTIPIMAARSGDFSQVVDSNGRPLPIYDPASTSLNPLYNSSQPVSITNLQYLRDQFPGNMIPLTRQDKVAVAAVPYLPPPNTNAGPFFQNNYYSVTPEVNTANGFILSVDHSFLQKNRVTVRIQRSTGQNGNAPVFLTAANSNNPSQLQSSRQLRIEHVYTASSTNVNTLTLNLSSNANRNQPQVAFVDGKPFPRYQFGNSYLSMGQNNPVSRDTFNNFFLTNTFASRVQKHRLSLQLEIGDQQVHTYRPQSPEGRFDFTSGLTSLPGIINTGDPFASFLLGQVAGAQQSVVVSPNYFDWWSYRWVFNDNWQLTPSLTVTIGANLETYTQRVDRYDRQSTVRLDVINPANGRPGALVAAGTNGYGRAFLPTWTRVEPALGVAWSVLGHNTTVLRLNYDRRYGSPNNNNGHWATQAFNGTPTYLSSNQQLQPALILAKGFLTPPFPDLRPEAANGTNAALVDPSGHQPTQHRFTIQVQHQLARNLILTGSFSRQWAKSQFTGNNLANLNAIPLTALVFRDKLNDLTFSNSLRPYPQYQDFDVQQFPLGKYRNQDMSVQLEKRTSGGFAVTVGVSRFLRYDDMSSPAQNVYDRRENWSIAQFSQPYGFNTTFLYELPFGPGKKFLTSGFVGRHLLGGWALSGNGFFDAGQPLRLTAYFSNTGGVIPVGRLLVNEVPGVDPHVAEQTPSKWFNPQAFVNPPDFTAGTGPRVHPTLRGPSAYNTDMTLNKRMVLGGDRTLEFTASLFNATNHANWNSPDTRIGTATIPNFNAGKIIGSNGGRIVQMGLRLNF